MLSGVEIEYSSGQNWVHPHKHWLCVDALNFDPRQHSILTPSSTWFWPPGLIFKAEKSYVSQFQKGFGFLRFYGKKFFFFNLRIPLTWIFLEHCLVYIIDDSQFLDFWQFSRIADIHSIPGKLSKIHFHIWLFSNPHRNVLFRLKKYGTDLSPRFDSLKLHSKEQPRNLCHR